MLTKLASVLIAPDIWGDIMPIAIDGQTPWKIGKDAFLASTQDVIRKNKSQGIGKGLCELAEHIINLAHILNPVSQFLERESSSLK